MKSLRWGLVGVAMVAAGARTLAKIGAEGERKQLIDVAEAQLFDGWGLAAVETLSMYYGAEAVLASAADSFSGSTAAKTDRYRHIWTAAYEFAHHFCRSCVSDF